MPTPAYPVHTARLTLRPFVAADLDDVRAYDSRADVARYLYWEPPDLAQSREALERNILRVGLAQEGDGLVLAMALRETGRVVGQVALGYASREHSQGEIGFVVNPEYHGRGLAGEAAGAMLRLAFTAYGLHRVFGRCDARNAASARLMQRLGMRQEAHLVESEFVKGAWTDELVYAMLRREWVERSAAST